MRSRERRTACAFLLSKEPSMITIPTIITAAATRALSSDPAKEAALSVLAPTGVSASRSQGGRRFGTQEAI